MERFVTVKSDGSEALKTYMEDVKSRIINEELLDNMIFMRELVLEVRKNKKKIIFAGNGASTLIASHGALDYVNQLGVKTLSIESAGFITAAGNDFGYEGIFERFVNLYAEKGDLIVVISSSGNSVNVINAANRGRTIGCKVVTFSGFKENNPLRKCGDVNFYTDADEYNKVESIHNLWLVSVCDFILKDEMNKVGIHGLEF